MIILYIFLGIIIFILLLLAMTLFIPVKTYIMGTFWDKKPTGLMEVYWIKYFFGSRIRIKDMEHLHILIWFFGIPIPLKFPLKKDDFKKKKSTESKEKHASEDPNGPVKIDENGSTNKESLGQKINKIVEAKDEVKKLWDSYKDYLRKIFVSYVTFSLEYIDAELGLEDPSKTGMAAGIVYSALSIKPLDNIRISYDYAKPNFNISAGIKMTMNLYGILCTLLGLYFSYKKDKKNEAQ